MKRYLFFPQLAAVLMLLSACSGADLLNAIVPDDSYTIVKNVAYGTKSRQRLDLYRPKDAEGETPIVVFFYGGNWDSGAKEDYRFVAEAFVSKGYITVIPDYRLYPEVRYPAFLEDAAAAVSWVRNSPTTSGVKPGPIYLVGHSAGAYIATMLSLEPKWLSDVGLKVCDTVSATVGLAGPYDFLPLKRASLKDIFGTRDERQQTQPINHVSGNAPPMLLISGLDDATVRPANTSRLAVRVREKGGDAEDRFYENTGHVALVASLAKPLRGLTPVLEDTDRFLRQQGRKTQKKCFSNNARARR